VWWISKCNHKTNCFIILRDVFCHHMIKIGMCAWWHLGWPGLISMNYRLVCLCELQPITLQTYDSCTKINITIHNCFLTRMFC
jgi:hypothetical protein